LTFVSDRAGQRDLWTRRADGTGTAELVVDREEAIRQGVYSSDGTWLVFSVQNTLVNRDIYAVRPDGGSAAITLVPTESDAYSPTLSPDGRWLAYVSYESGRDEVYVRPFPDATSGGLWSVSTDGGYEPVWAPSGRELFYRNAADELVAVQVTGDPTFAPGRRVVLFSMEGYLPGSDHPQYDVSPDGREFVMLRIVEEEMTRNQFILVDNWFEELRGRAEN
jgi:serine/threonine-protein kinase